MKRCRYCAEEIQEAAIRCKHCRSDLAPVAGRLGRLLFLGAALGVGLALLPALGSPASGPPVAFPEGGRCPAGDWREMALPPGHPPIDGSLRLGRGRLPPGHVLVEPTFPQDEPKDL